MGSPLLLMLFAWIVRFVHKRKVNIVIAGISDAGKTALWGRWREQYNPNPEPSVSPAVAPIEPVELRKWTLQPKIIDTPGTQPEHVLAGILRAKGFRGAIAWSRTKYVLVYVVAPCGKPPSAPGSSFDAIYIAEQKGNASSLPLALIRQHDPRIRLDLVVMFATKFDLLDNDPPKYSKGPARAEMTDAFEPHRELIQNACKEANIPFNWIIGSAERDWAIDELRDSVKKVLQ